MKITYKKSPVNEDRFSTAKYENLFTSIQGHVVRFEGDDWDGQIWDDMDGEYIEIRYNFISKLAATRWVNSELRKRGVG